MKKITTIIIGLFVAVLALTFPQQAQAKISAPSAVLNTPDIAQKADNRVEILRAYFESKNSPLAPHAATFIREADKSDLDWRLVAAIAGLESSFGLHIPYNSYNAWGYGVYGTNVRRFESWDDGIAVVSKALREDYMTKWKAKTIPEIGRIYAASPTWAQRVQYFINDIDNFEQKQARTTLALSL